MRTRSTHLKRSRELNVVRKLLDWFPANSRDLPWRRTRDPYAIWVSEVMLQQTQVQTVIPYWERWMHRLPTVEALARCPPDTLLKLWEGLGYYTRARNLQRAAQCVLERHYPAFPQECSQWLALPGIGRYTAGAICSIAFDQPTPILDGNVVRVLTRVFGISGDTRSAAVKALLWSSSERLVEIANAERSPSASRPCSTFNQSLMELGATICLPRNPRCALCPVRKDCFAFTTNRIGQFPQVSKRPEPTIRHFAAFVAYRDQSVLLRQRPEGVVNARLWEFPNLETDTRELSPEDLARTCLGCSVTSIAHLCTIQHSITRFRIRLQVYRVSLRSPSRTHSPHENWATVAQLEEHALPSAHRKIARLLAKPEQTRVGQ